VSYSLGYAWSHPLTLNADYPYTSKDGFSNNSTCKEKNYPGIVYSQGYTTLRRDPAAMKMALNVSPIAATVDATSLLFSNY